MNVTRSILTLLLALATLFNAAPATAGILDFIRNYDLNDYALGVAVTVSQSPYTAGSSSITPYPYLTSFNDPAFTRDWLLLFDDAGTGLRYVSESGFEIGAVGRVRTGGFGADVTQEYFELREREWTAELGAIAGYRGWPIHFQGRVYTDVLGRHGGEVSELSVSWPLQRDWGFFIPMVDAVHQSGEFNRYYFGVTEAESRPGRPEYAPGADTNIRVRLRAGYRLSDHWLLTGYLQAEMLGDEISNSPIVDRDTLYSYNIGLAYNADIFNPRDYAYSKENDASVELRVGAFYNNISTEFQLFANEGIPGDIFDIEAIGDAPESRWVPEFDLFVRLGNYHRLDFGYFEVGRSATSVSLVPRRVGDVTLPEGVRFDIATRMQVLRAMYTYSLMRDAQKELALGGGLHRSKFEVDITNEAGERQLIRGDAVLPAISAHGSVNLGSRSTVSARLQFFRSVFDSYDGFMLQATLDWSRQIAQKSRAGVALNFYSLSLDATGGNFQGTYRSLHWGPSVFFTVGF